MGTLTRLADEDQIALERCEARILAGKNAFLDVAQALLVIRDRELYRVDHRTFEEYCIKRWGFTARNGFRLVAAGEAAQELAGHGLAPDSIRSANAYGGADDDEKEAMRDAAEDGVLDSRAVRTGKESVRVTRASVDDEEDPREPFLELSSAVDAIGRDLKALGETPIGKAMLDLQVIVATIGDLRRAIHSCTPVAKCPYCTHNPDGRKRCSGCRGCGYLSYGRWKATDQNLRSDDLLLGQR